MRKRKEEGDSKKIVRRGNAQKEERRRGAKEERRRGEKDKRVTVKAQK